MTRQDFRYELRSAEQLAQLAAAELPLGLPATAPVHSAHRDLYLDTSDDALRRRGVSCRLRLHAGGDATLSLRIGGTNLPAVRVDAPVRGGDVAAALAEDNPATRRLRAFIDARLLAARLDLEVERLTRTACPDLLRRPRVTLHYDEVTVRRDGAAATFHRLCGHARRGPRLELERLAHALEREHGLRVTTTDARDQAELLVRWTSATAGRAAGVESDQVRHVPAPGTSGEAEMLNPELSLLAFQRRVLAMAQDDSTPLRERFRFLSIVTSNLDELYMVRMADLVAAARDEEQDATVADDGLTASRRLARVEAEIAHILSLQFRCAQDCLRAAETVGVRLLPWSALGEAARAELTRRCREEIHPGLSPLAMTLSPGHPLPHLPHLGLSLAVVFRHTAQGEPHLAQVELPDDAPRLLPVPGDDRAAITIEEVLRANVGLLHPNSIVDSAYLFRVTRGGDLALDEGGAADLLDAVATATGRRPLNPAVRVEVERAMPDFVSRMVLENLRREAVALGTAEPVRQVQVVQGLLDLRCLTALPLPDDPTLQFSPMQPRTPYDRRSLFDQVRDDGDILVHHPFDSFDATVARFVADAAADAAVTAIKITLYRVGQPSPVVDALLHAAERGKRVTALVELKARFDEEHNVAWARALERAGGHVVYGLVGFKVHAKVALVVRREGERLQRYVHVGTGNYSARSGRDYTDLSLFSARESLATDVSDLFNELSGSSRPPRGLQHGALVAPHQLLPALLGLIERETANARLGLPAAVTIKVNGLSDPDIVRALYRAAQAGVRVELVVRGICTLRPRVDGLSPGIRVVSVVGRWLEHSRIYRFENAGERIWLIGSSDLRPRNLRRRVELLVPVTSPAHRAELDRILALYLDDGTGWELRPDGEYVQRARTGPGAQMLLSSPS